ncbi:hypothetical protein GCM10010123_07770 [Pilimelia anulata]|uniref:Alpha/beta hydrolase n=1 Tax=Pilimelia anulata TaxID=53371 RepID=A0A8J3B7G5_9ACTN|nr:alpha/beta hydrolase [Pilimelia anulata]GGJ80275.1 hypothetical protein GCM10010123_07770 [Pilimelia anulata]
MAPLVLVHGGLWDSQTAGRYWHDTGVSAALAGHGLRVSAPERPDRAPSWVTEGVHLLAALPAEPVTLIAASHGCSAAVRAALIDPGRVRGLLLAWPATAGDPDVDASTHARLDSLGARTAEVSQLLDGQTLRGVTHAELTALRMPVGVLPALPENRQHQRRTVDALLARLPHARELPGCPEPVRSDFAEHLPRFVGTIISFVDDLVGPG